MSEPRTPLGVMLPEIGVASETFLRWDVEQLLPGGTAVIADPPPGGISITGATTWGLDGQPALVFPPVPGDPPPTERRIASVTEFLRRNGVEVVLIEYLDFADRWFDVLLDTGVRVWPRAHGLDVSARLRDPAWVARYRRFGAAEGIIVPSRAAAQELYQLGLPSNKVHVVAHAVEVPRRAHRHRPFARCVSVGRLVPKKAPLLTLEAFRRARRHCPGLTLDLVGDGPLAEAVATYVATRGLAEAVRLHGQLDHPRTLALVRQGDLLLHHAIAAEDGDSEGQPLAILEAMAAGLAVITTRHAGIPEVVIDGRTGRLVAEGDVAGMAAWIIELAGDPATRLRLGAAARRSITATHTTAPVQAELRGLLGLAEDVGDKR